MPSKSNSILHWVIFILCIQLFACKSKTKDEPALEPEQASVYESAEFQDFYQKFSTDSVFQMEHVVFPLEGMRSPKDSLDIIDPNFRWQQDSWKIHKPYDDMNGTYIREFIDIPGIVSERISDESGQYSMERRFGKLSSGWHLIYYREMGRY